MNQITVTVPATTANLGPGFDCLGLALGLYNTITVTAVSQPILSITITGEGAERIPTDSTNLVVQSAEKVFEQVGKRPIGLHIHQHNNIPSGSGLGSSASAVLGGMLAANALLDSPLTPAQVLQLAAQKEGHPDNVTPALYGGLTLTVQEGETLYVERIAVPAMQAVIVLPDFDLPTSQARAALPQQVPLKDAVFNIGRSGLLMRALEQGNFAKLRVAMQDRLHQPYRLPLIPGITAAFAAAYAAGAMGVALSGAGPSVLALAPTHHQYIAQAITAEFTAAHLTSRTWVLPIDEGGAVISKR